MTIRTRGQVLGHDLRRVVQTPRAFANWPVVLADMARERLGGGPDELAFDTRSGRRISCPNRPGARVPVYEIFAEDCYHLSWFLGPMIDAPLHVLDIGAHVGTFTCRLTQVHPDVHVQCFEPSRTTASYLRRNIAQNGLGARVTVTEAALAAQAGYAEFEDNGAASGMNGLRQVYEIGGRKTGTRVETTTFDAAVAEAAGPVRLVKMDCEGGEYELVFGSNPDSWASVERVVLEYHDVPGQSWPSLRSWFGLRGLRIVHEEPVTAGLGTAWLSRSPLPAVS